jgi:hypothetical protein
MRFKFTTTKDKRPTAKQAAATVADLKSDLQNLTAAFAEAEAEYGPLSVAAKADPSLAAALRKSEARLIGARSAIENGKITLAAAEQYLAEIVATESAAETTARWNALEERKKTRKEKALKVARLAAEFQAARQEFLVACDLEAACPVSLAQTYEPALARAAVGDAHLRLELHRLGVKWASGGKWPWDAHTIKPLVTAIEEADGHLDRLRQEARPAAAE